MQIGAHVLRNALFVAPMAGVTDRPFRVLARRFGAGLAVSEMISSRPELRDSRKSRLRRDHEGEPGPVSVQIAGADPAMMAEAARENVAHGAQIIDINMGCPAKKVCNAYAGSALLENEALVARILRAVVAAVEVPVTLKIRTGPSPERRNAVRVARIAEEAGVAHGLLYHYFASKEEVLQTIFRENWGELIERFRAVEAAEEPAAEKLEGVAKILLRTWRNDPDLVTVMVREVARSPQLQTQVVEVREAFAIVQRIVEQGQRDGDFRPEVDARLASWLLYGGLEEVLTGWVLGGLPADDREVARAERTAIDLALRGLSD